MGLDPVTDIAGAMFVKSQTSQPQTPKDPPPQTAAEKAAAEKAAADQKAAAAHTEMMNKIKSYATQQQPNSMAPQKATFASNMQALQNQMNYQPKITQAPQRNYGTPVPSVNNMMRAR